MCRGICDGVSYNFSNLDASSLINEQHLVLFVAFFGGFIDEEQGFMKGARGKVGRGVIKA